jgi:hypothetical protein
MPRSGATFDKMAWFPSLDKEGRTAAGGCCRGGSKAVKVSEIAALGTSPQHPSWAFGPASPPQLRRRAYFQESRACRGVAPPGMKIVKQFPSREGQAPSGAGVGCG